MGGRGVAVGMGFDVGVFVGVGFGVGVFVGAGVVVAVGSILSCGALATAGTWRGLRGRGPPAYHVTKATKDKVSYQEQASQDCHLLSGEVHGSLPPLKPKKVSRKCTGGGIFIVSCLDLQVNRLGVL